MKNKLNVGIIGCGQIAEIKHIPAIMANSDLAQLVAVQDLDLQRAKYISNKHTDGKAGVYENYTDLLRDPAIDVVHVCTPNSTHAEISILAMEEGKHVLCEKPIAHTLEAAENMIETQKKTGKKLSISFQNRFRRDSLAIKQACMDGLLGEIYFAKAHAVRRKKVPTWGSFTDIGYQGGGPLIDIGSHSIDLALWFMDNYEIDSVVGSCYRKLYDNPEGNVFGPWDPNQFSIEDSAFGFVKMKNGATLVVEAAYALNTTESKEAMTTLCGTKGGAQQNEGDFGYGSFSYTINTVINGDLVTIHPDYPYKYTIDKSHAQNELMTYAPKIEFKRWFNAIINDKEPDVLPIQAYTVSKLINAIYESAKTGKQIFFD